MAIDDALTILGPWPAAPAVGHRRAVDQGLRGAARNTRCTHKAGGVQGPWPATTAETAPGVLTRRASASDGTNQAPCVHRSQPTCRSSGANCSTGPVAVVLPA